MSTHSRDLTMIQRGTSRSTVLAGTALVLVLSGAALGTQPGWISINPANAAPVQADVAAPVGFADLVDKVRPAVVSVRVQSVETVASTDNFFDLPQGSPFDQFFRQFQQNNPQFQTPRAPRTPSQT